MKGLLAIIGGALGALVIAFSTLPVAAQDQDEPDGEVGDAPALILDEPSPPAASTALTCRNQATGEGMFIAQPQPNEAMQPIGGVYGFLPGSPVEITVSSAVGNPTISSTVANDECFVYMPVVAAGTPPGEYLITWRGVTNGGAPFQATARLTVKATQASAAVAPTATPWTVSSTCRTLPNGVRESCPSTPNGSDFEVYGVVVTMDWARDATGQRVSATYHISGLVRNNGPIPGVARLAIETADHRPNVAVEVGSAPIGTGAITGTDNIQPGASAIFSADGPLRCGDCRFPANVLPGNDQVVVSVQGAFAR